MITEELAGIWLDGAYGWHNAHRVIEIAQSYGFTLSHVDEVIVAAYREGIDGGTITLPNGESMAAADVADAGREISAEATDYLQSLAPIGFTFEWDMGELSLVKVDEQD